MESDFSISEPFRASADGGGGTGGGADTSWYECPPVGMEYGVSSGKNTGRFEMCDVVDSRSASNASKSNVDIAFAWLPDAPERDRGLYSEVTSWGQRIMAHLSQVVTKTV